MYKKYFKRIFDLILCIIALPIFIVTLTLVGALIYLEDKGPILYNAFRLGKDGKIFRMYKFRSMRLHAPDIRNKDGSTFNSEDDPRLTRVGRFIRKTSIDEIPQLLNVLKGDMSVIGPRPDLPEHLMMYEGNESRKLETRPGMTGYNQAYYRNTIPWKNRIKNDIYYIDHMSALLDIKVLFKTVASVLQRKNIFMESNSTSKNNEDGNE